METMQKDIPPGSRKWSRPKMQAAGQSESKTWAGAFDPGMKATQEGNMSSQSLPY